MACGVMQALKQPERLFIQASQQIGNSRTNDYIHGALHEALPGMLFNGINNGFIPDAVSAPPANHPVYQYPSLVPGHRVRLRTSASRVTVAHVLPFVLFSSSRCHNASTVEMEELAIGWTAFPLTLTGRRRAWDRNT